MSQRSVPLTCPVRPDPVDPPNVRYGPVTDVRFVTDQGLFARATFEGLDAIRVCRGEYEPYEPSEGSAFAPVQLVQDSAWLRERHDYEARHYRGAFEFGNDVARMLTDYLHYVLHFHDEYVEAIAKGIWFEESNDRIPDDHVPEPFRDLTQVVEEFTSHGIPCQVRASSIDPELLLDRAALCSQPLYHFAMTLDGKTSIAYRMSVRSIFGNTRSIWKNLLGREDSITEGVATLEAARSLFEPYVESVRRRRDEMGRSC